MVPNLLDVGFGMIQMMICETSLERTDALADQLLGGWARRPFIKHMPAGNTPHAEPLHPRPCGKAAPKAVRKYRT